MLHPLYISTSFQVPTIQKKFGNPHRKRKELNHGQGTGGRKRNSGKRYKQQLGNSTTADFFSREGCVKTNQKNAKQPGGPTLFVCFSDDYGRYVIYARNTAELSIVAKYILQPK
jgi:hypothetical protein